MPYIVYATFIDFAKMYKYIWLSEFSSTAFHRQNFHRQHFIDSVPINIDSVQKYRIECTKEYK